MDKIITDAYNLLSMGDMRVIGKNIGDSETPIWTGVEIVDLNWIEDDIYRGLHCMSVEEVLCDANTCTMIFDYHVKTYFDTLMGV